MKRLVVLGAGTALAAIWLLTGVNAMGVREAGIVQLATTVLKLLPLLAIGTLGLLYLDLFWNLATPDEAAHLVRGKLQGDGPWKVEDNSGTTRASVRVLGCQHTDPALHPHYQPWKAWLESNPGQYPGPEQIRQIARKLGATPTTHES